ncbi:hypothetical protein PLESTB_000729900 [Pleodorina starrii]|uniref:Glutamine amidotransferase domain-containing protein n=1 Tax=Pleodorina starrii TaxID=330485 RepID=A0A9W6BKW9_9CHLO|nr:hypothetical protein PLESTM_000194100 [Pleodorina starrii]GLC53301.1 hypothetical protein PLESTB_000729900 [Pleodorina starrii]GLC67230.1 hypothetical protein PLESTF_000531400 [Pleodorina starrii]
MRIALLNCEDAEKWRDWTERPERLWGGLLQSSADTFTTFRCHAGEFPDPVTCRELYDAILVGGSHYSAYDDLPWIRQLGRLLPQYIRAGVRVVGCCFGHQLLAKALGGAVGKNPSGRFVLGVEDVSVDVAAARQCGLLLPPPLDLQQQHATAAGAGAADGGSGAAAAAGGAAAAVGGASGSVEAGAESAGASPRVRLRMLQSHGDQVLALPPGASLLATSGTADHEMWALGKRCLAFQFHPELTPDLVYDKIWSAVTANGRLDAEEAAVAEAQLKAGPGAVDSDLFQQALAAFLRAPAPEPAPLPESGDAAETAAAAAAEAAASAAAEAASGGVRVATALRQALEGQAGDAAEAVLGHVRQAASAGMAAGTANAELLTALNQAAAASYGRAATAAEGAAAQLSGAVAAQRDPLKAALASLGALETQLDRLAAVVGSLELQSADMEAQAEAAAREATQQVAQQPAQK